MASDLIDEAYGYPDDSPKCKACGVKMINHLGLLGTCKALLETKKTLKEYEDLCHRLTDEIHYLRDRIDESKEDSVKLQNQIISLKETIGNGIY